MTVLDCLVEGEVEISFFKLQIFFDLLDNINNSIPPQPCKQNPLFSTPLSICCSPSLFTKHHYINITTHQRVYPRTSCLPSPEKKVSFFFPHFFFRHESRTWFVVGFSRNEMSYLKYNTSRKTLYSP